MPESPRFSHLDDLEYQEVHRVAQGDRTMSVREKWLGFSPRFVSRFLAARGARPLPNPPIDMPDWIEDTRS